MDGSYRGEGDISAYHRSELAWIRASDFLPWSEWDYELLGEATYGGASFYIADVARATYGSGRKQRSRPLNSILYRVLGGLPRRVVRHRYYLDVLVLRSELGIWENAAKAAELALKVCPKLVTSGDFGNVRIRERADGTLECQDRRVSSIPTLDYPPDQ